MPPPLAGITAGPDGNVWFSESEAGQIGRIAPDGTVTEFRTGITPGSRPLLFGALLIVLGVVAVLALVLLLMARRLAAAQRTIASRR